MFKLIGKYLCVWAVVLGVAPLSAATPNIVFHGAVEGDPIFRAPQLAVANDGSLLVFAENRETLDDPGRGEGLISVVMKRSTDLGTTWATMQVLVSDGTYDYNGVAPVVDRDTGEVFLTFNRVPNYLIGGVVPTGTGSNTLIPVCVTPV